MRDRTGRSARFDDGWLGLLAVIAVFLVLAYGLQHSVGPHDSEFRLSHWHDVALLVLLSVAFGFAVFWRRAFRAAQAGARHNAELRDGLEVNLQRYRSLFDLNPEAAYSLDLEGRFVSMNAATERITGYTSAEFLGRSFAPLVAPECLDEVTQNFTRACAGASPEYRTVVLHRDGHRMNIAVKNVPILVNHEVVGVYGIARDVTWANQARAELERLHTGMEAISEGIAITGGPTNIVLYVNRARAAMHGYASPEDLIGESTHTLYSAAEHERLATEVAPLQREGESWSGEVTAARVDGTTFTAEMSVSALDDGEFVSVARDITERKAAETALRTSERRFRDSLAQITDGYFEADLRGMLTFSNHALCRITGQSAQELAGLNLRALTDTENTARVEEQFRAVLATGAPNRGFDWPLIRHDGAVRFVETSISPIRDDGGAPTGFRGVLRDVTDRKAADERLRESEKRYELVSRATREVLWDLDLVVGTARWSGAVEAMLGYRNTDIPVDNDWMFSRVHPDDRELVTTSFDELLGSEEERLWSAEFRFQVHDGYYVDVLSRGYLVRDESGSPDRFVGSFMDITDRKRDEDLVADARREADEANGAKSMFLANMSHELRTPMHGVIGMVDLLLTTELDDEQAEYAETVRRSGESLLHIISDILDLSKIEAGRLTLESASFDLGEMMIDAARPLTNAAQRKGVVLTTAFDPGIPNPVKGDAWRTGQVLTNLLANAVKFTDDGTVRLGAEVVERDGDSVRVVFRVEDTGIGMTAEQVDLLFRPFSQVDASATRRFGGTGLGLSISRQLAELMGGRISVESRRNVGSTFTFEVPFSLDADAATPEADSAPALPVAEEASAVSGTHRLDADAVPVLLVEDSPVNQQVAVGMLRRLGYTVDIASDGVEALTALSRATYAAVLMDLQMPNMDGYETARRIRRCERDVAAHAAQRRTPVIAMTASALEGERERVLAAGMDDYLPKPFRARDLRVVLDRWAGSHGAIRGTGAMAASTMEPSNPGNASGDTLDDKVLSELRQLDARLDNDFLATLVSEFLSDTAGRLPTLREAVRSGDSEEVRRTAHLLKGSSRAIGAKRLGALFAQLEAAAGSGNLHVGADLVDTIGDDLVRTGPALRAALLSGNA